jgi:hypothetical protein
MKLSRLVYCTNTFSFTDVYHEIKLHASEPIRKLYVGPTNQNFVNICNPSYMVLLLVKRVA